MMSAHSWQLRMNWVFTSIIINTVLQVSITHFRWTMLFSIVGRVLFLLRLVGCIIPSKVSMGFEIAHGFFIVLGIIFSKSELEWGSILLTALFCAITCLLYFIDDTFYLYITRDEEE